MGVDKRKAFIEFVEKDTVCITTPFRQKTFNLHKINKSGKYINLHTLELFPAPKEGDIKPPFHAMATVVEEREENDKDIRLVVVARVSESDERIIGEMSVGDEQLFKVSVVES